MENTVNVIKRDGSVAPLKVSEIRKKISEIVELTVPEHLREETTQNIEINLRQYIKNNIHTSEIQTWLIKSIVEMIDIDKPYLEYSAAKAVLQKIYHDVYKNTNISVYPEDLQSAFKKYIKTYSSKALLSPKFKELTESQLNLLSDMIDYSRDNLFKYIGIHTLQSRYLLRDKGLIVELPQWRFMTIAMYLAFHDSDTIDVDQAQKYYDLLSTFKFMCATPTLNNGGKIRHQLSSCFVLQVPDNIEGIFDISKEVAIYSKWGGGAGGDITSVRGRNGPIRGMPGKSKGVISWSKIYNDTVVAVDQLGCVAKGSIVQRLSKIASVDGHLVGIKAFDPTYRMYYVEQLNKEILKFEDYTDFLSKSPVKWQAETVTIDRIIEGDYVLSYDINTKSWCYKKVLQVHDDITVETKDQIQITTEYDSVITSKWHPMLIERNNELVYVKSEELKIGDQVVTLFPGKDPRSRVVDINFDPKANTHYYDLSVEDTNNYACSSLTDPANTVKYPQVAMSVIHNTRPGALALYLQLWHTDLLDFLSMRRNSGDDRQRARDIFPGITVPDLFMQRLEQGGNWSFFDPYQHPELVDSHSDEFKRLYEAAELKGDAISTIPCIEVWREVIKMQLETGMPFIMFKDTVNRANRHPEAGFIYSSQLCSEITLPTKPNIYGIEVTYKDGTKEVFPHDTYIQKFGCISNNITESHPGIVQVDTVIYELGETAVCNLGSINLVEYYHMVPEKRKEMVFNCVKFLDSVIDLNMYVTPQSRKGAHKTRAIGLGVMNEHALLAELKIHYGSEQHEKLIHDLYASIEEYSDKASEMISGTPGVRKNLYIRAIAPTGSISLITGCTSSHDPIYKRKWFEENALGSIPVLVPNLSPDTWEYYTPAFDIDPEDAVKINAARQKYIDQAISFAIYIDPNKEYTNPETGEKITPAAKLSRALKLAWKLGIKTTYYIRSKSSDINEELNTMKVACEGCQ